MGVYVCRDESDFAGWIGFQIKSTFWSTSSVVATGFDRRISVQVWSDVCQKLKSRDDSIIWMCCSNQQVFLYHS